MTSITVALPLNNAIDSFLPTTIINFFLTNVWLSQLFYSSQYPYIKDDLASKQRNGLFCNIMRSHKDSFGFSQTGIIRLEVHLSLTYQRTLLAENARQISNLIQIMNLNQLMSNYVKSIYPWVFWVGKKMDVDYRDVWAKESKFVMDMDYSVDFVAYKNWLNTHGYAFESPDTIIYPAVEALLEQIAILDPELNPVIVV
jgi:hypothetical protein